MSAEVSDGAATLAPLLAIRGLTLRYRRRGLLSQNDHEVTALQDISLDVYEGKTLALVGPSGSGKSSLARCVVLVEKPQSGAILFGGKNLVRLAAAERRQALREIQIVFQDSAAALNPSFTVEEVLSEPMVIQKLARSSAEKRDRIRELLQSVELSEKISRRRPLELSGGQRQRVAIARALAPGPKMLILDEALSALDLSTRGQITNLLLGLQEARGLAYLFITHDLSMAQLLADEVAKMAGGRIIKSGTLPAGVTPNLQARREGLSPHSSSGETLPMP